MFIEILGVNDKTTIQLIKIQCSAEEIVERAECFEIIKARTTRTE